MIFLEQIQYFFLIHSHAMFQPPGAFLFKNSQSQNPAIAIDGLSNPPPPELYYFSSRDWPFAIIPTYRMLTNTPMTLAVLTKLLTTMKMYRIQRNRSQPVSDTHWSKLRIEVFVGRAEQLLKCWKGRPFSNTVTYLLTLSWNFGKYFTNSVHMSWETTK